MTGLYLFAAAAGVPLVLWFMLSGDDDGGGDAGGGEGDGVGGVGGNAFVMFRRLPLGTVAFVAAAFGICGIALGLVGASRGSTFVVSAVAGVVAGVLNATLFAYLRRSESSTDMSDGQLSGKIGRVVLPVTSDQRGRIAVTVGGQQIHLSADAVPGSPAELQVGAAVLVVEVRNGVASITRLDPELG